MPGSRMPQLVLCLALVAGATVGCVGAGAGRDPAATASPAVRDPVVAYDEVNDAVAAIAEDQAALSPPMAALLSSLRAVDRAVADLRDPDRVDAAVDAWPPLDGDLAAAPLEEVRRAAREVAARVDETRIELAAARSSLDDDWERRYLDAQDLVLQEVRTYARTSDELAQVLALHLGTYRQLLERSAAFVEERGFYRSAEEASNAYEVEIGRLLDELTIARQQIARFVDGRDAAALDVNAATAAAADVWARRPDPEASPAGTP